MPTTGLAGRPQLARRLGHLSPEGERTMSGPIVRKYGFPNFERIFGERPLEHGVDEPEQSGDQPEQSNAAKPKKKAATKPKSSKPKKT
jgi:hypothetical protein